MENIEKASSSSGGARKRKISRGFECTAFGCGSTYNDTSGNRTPFYFFKFPTKNSEQKCLV